MTQTVLILGATGRFGRNAANAFAQANWNVIPFDRRKDELMQAVQGVDVIVNAWNPVYPDWETQVPKLHAQVIKAAKSVDATVIVPGNVYVYGADTPAPWSLTSQHNAQNKLGKIRRNMERAYRDSGVKTILLRAGDYIDTEASGNWFDQILTAKLGKGILSYPGQPNIDHAWAYLPDVTRAAVQLAQMRDDLHRYEEVLFEGYTLTGHQLAEYIHAATGVNVKLKQMNWLPIRLVAPVWNMGRSLLEMRYLWDTPHRLDPRRFDQLLPDFVPTPIDQALRRALPQAASTSDYGGTSTSIQTSA